MDVTSIIQNAQEKIMESLKKRIDDNTDPIIKAIIKNLTDNKELYQEILADFKQKIDKTFDDNMKKKIQDDYENITKKLIQNIVKTDQMIQGVPIMDNEPGSTGILRNFLRFGNRNRNTDTDNIPKAKAELLDDKNIHTAQVISDADVDIIPSSNKSKKGIFRMFTGNRIKNNANTTIPVAVEAAAAAGNNAITQNQQFRNSSLLRGNNTKNINPGKPKTNSSVLSLNQTSNSATSNNDPESSSSTVEQQTISKDDTNKTNDTIVNSQKKSDELTKPKPSIFTRFKKGIENITRRNNKQKKNQGVASTDDTNEEQVTEEGKNPANKGGRRKNRKRTRKLRKKI